MEKKRCSWAENTSDNYQRYHDEEWGVPVYDDEKLYEMLLLESFQAGLSWLIILNKRDNFKEAYDNFDPIKIANYQEDNINELLQNKGIIRNRLKIQASIINAQVFLDIQKEFGSFSNYLWGFTNHQVIKNTTGEFFTRTKLSDDMAKDLKKRGMKFMGTVTLYSYLQAIGVVNDHELDCFKYSKD